MKIVSKIKTMLNYLFKEQANFATLLYKCQLKCVLFCKTSLQFRLSYIKMLVHKRKNTIH